MTIKKGQQVNIKKQYQDEGDDEFVWIASEDEDGGRVLLEVDVGLFIRKTEVFQIYMLEEQ